jgi:hypothetical protein
METVTMIINGSEVEIPTHAVQKAKDIFGAVEKE